VLGGTIWKTTIFLTNPASSGVASGSVTFFKDDANVSAAGSAFAISFVDDTGVQVGSGNTVPFQIGPGQSRKYTSTGTGIYAGGFAVVSSNATVNGTAIFSEFDLGGRLIAEAGVPGGLAVPRQAIFVDTIGGYNIGVAFANPGSSAAGVTLSLLLNTGAAAAVPTTVNLGANNHKAAFVTELFPGTAQFAGTMQITGASPVSAIALRFDPTFSVFTTLPPVTLASLISPALEWFQQRSLLAPLTSVARLLGAFQVRLG
jgi:hypothetical protein